MFAVSTAECRISATDLHTKPAIWLLVGVDLFYLRGKDYPSRVDFRSGFPEVACLPSANGAAGINSLKNAFARHVFQKR